MAKQILKDQSVYLDGYDLTGRSNAIALDYSADLAEVTTLGKDFKERIGGLKTTTVQVAGFSEKDATEGYQFGKVGLVNAVLTLGASGDEVGNIAYTMQAGQADIKFGAAVGEVYKFDAGGMSTGALVRGKIVLNSKNSPLVSTGAGPGNFLGSIVAGQRACVAMHVLGAGSGSVTCKLQSDATNSFSGAQTDRIIFDAATGVGAQWKTLAGPVTDTWWRIVYTISGGAPSFKLVFVVGFDPANISGTPTPLAPSLDFSLDINSQYL